MVLKCLSFFCLVVLAAGVKRHRGQIPIQGGNFLQVQGREFVYNGVEVYLSGTNAAWIQYGYDFGNNQWEQSTKTLWEENIRLLGDGGANSIRVWLHVEGDNTPHFGSDGFVLGPDEAGTLINDLREFLDLCQANNIFVNLVLWNGALMRNGNYEALLYDNDKLQSYIDNALVPLVQGLKDHPALAAWEPMNEPEGLVKAGVADARPCFDTTHLTNTRVGPEDRGPGWAGDVPYRNILLFNNWIADAIHTNDPKALVSCGAWSHFTSSDANAIFESDNKNGFNHYKDECLLEAGGRPKGVVDFWQFHSYPWAGQWQFGQPWTNLKVDDYELDAPLVVGEFCTKLFCDTHGGQGQTPDGWTTTSIVEYLYENDYNGGWTWYLENNNLQDDPDVLEGTQCLVGREDHGLVDIIIS